MGPKTLKLSKENVVPTFEHDGCPMLLEFEGGVEE